MKIRVDFQTTKYLVLVWFWKRKCPPYEQRWRSKYGCIEQYLEDKNCRESRDIYCDLITLMTLRRLINVATLATSVSMQGQNGHDCH